jgi:hypothetical protein
MLLPRVLRLLLLLHPHPVVMILIEKHGAVGTSPKGENGFCGALCSLKCVRACVFCLDRMAEAALQRQTVLQTDPMDVSAPVSGSPAAAASIPIGGSFSHRERAYLVVVIFFMQPQIELVVYCGR